jgi:hypothetical protein
MSRVAAIVMFLGFFGLSAKAAPWAADHCLDGQNLRASDVDIRRCPALPTLPEPVRWLESGDRVSLGAWELGQTREGLTYKYGSLTEPNTQGARRLRFYDEEDSTAVDSLNLRCWAKGYYRLRKILQNPPEAYVRLREAGFQGRFFQFQTDLRYGGTGFRQISSFRDHLVKWVTVIRRDGTCVQPRLQDFEAYLEGELERRGLR